MMMAANDDEKAIDRACDGCGEQFDSGSFLIDGGRVVSVMCSTCHDPADEVGL
jgi:hypothetical protein